MNSKVKIDHVGIINNNSSVCKEVFNNLGFCNGTASVLESGISSEKSPQNMHYVFDNTYIECITTSGDDYLNPYLKSDCGMHILVLATDNILKSKDNLNKEFNVSNVMEASRSADHGAIKGTAQFLWIQINEEIIEDTLLGVVEHQTLNLIYQDEKYLHKNGVNKIKEVIVSCNDNVKSKIDLENICNNLELSNDFSYIIDDFNYLSKDEILEQFKINVEDNLSPYCGIVFSNADLKFVENAAKESDYQYTYFNNKIIIDLRNQMQMFFVFENKGE